MFAYVAFADGVNAVVKTENITHFDSKHYIKNKKYNILWDEDENYYEGVILSVGDVEEDLKKEYEDKRPKIPTWSLCQSASELSDSNISPKKGKENQLKQEASVINQVVEERVNQLKRKHESLKQEASVINEVVEERVNQLKRKHESLNKKDEANDQSSQELSGIENAENSVENSNYQMSRDSMKMNIGCKIITSENLDSDRNKKRFKGNDKLNEGACEPNKQNETVDLKKILKSSNRDTDHRKKNNSKNKKKTDEKKEISTQKKTNDAITASKNASPNMNDNSESDEVKKLPAVRHDQTKKENDDQNIEKNSQTQSTDSTVRSETDKYESMESKLKRIQHSESRFKKILQDKEKEITGYRQRIEDMQFLINDLSRTAVELTQQVINKFDEQNDIIRDLRQSSEQASRTGAYPRVGFDDKLKNSTHIGRGQYIPTPKFNTLMAQDKPTIFVRELARNIFGNKVLAESTVSGKFSNRSSTSKNRDPKPETQNTKPKPPAPKPLDPIKLDAIRDALEYYLADERFKNMATVVKDQHIRSVAVYLGSLIADIKKTLERQKAKAQDQREKDNEIVLKEKTNKAPSNERTGISAQSKSEDTLDSDTSDSDTSDSDTSDSHTSQKSSSKT